MFSRSLIARYLARDILQSTVAVALVLLVIFLSGRFAKYLVDAASGKISAEIIFTLLLYRTPGIFERILPLSLFLGILLVFGRLYVENEIAALHAAGVGVPQLLRACTLAILPVALFTAFLCLYVSPAGFQNAETMLNDEKKRSELDLIEPGKFLQLRGRGGVVYTGEIGAGRQTMRDVFLASQREDGQWTVLRADHGEQYYDGSNTDGSNTDGGNARYLALHDGQRYTLLPGQTTAERLHFASLHQHMQTSGDYEIRKFKEDTLPTTTLLQQRDKPEYQATLQWRLSLIVLVPLVSVIAVAMSRTTPRRGRYIKLLPAMLLYFAYMTALDMLRHKMSNGDWPALPGLLTAHVLFLLIALLLLYSDRLAHWKRPR